VCGSYSRASQVRGRHCPFTSHRLLILAPLDPQQNPGDLLALPGLGLDGEDRRRQRLDRGGLEEAAEGELDLEGLGDPRHELGREQRVPAEAEEAVMDPGWSRSQ
jgi:hypothetical protein